MTTRKRNAKQSAVEVVAGDRDLIKALMKEALQEVLEGEMTDFLGAAPSERTDGRQGYRAGYYGRNLVTRIGKLELRIPRDRSGEFSTALFERYARSEKALVAALAEMYVQGVSTRKVTAITEELCGHRFSASAISPISAINKSLDATLAKFAGRRLDETYPYLILDARYERVREAGVIAHRAVLVAIGINWIGQCQQNLPPRKRPLSDQVVARTCDPLPQLSSRCGLRAPSGRPSASVSPCAAISAWV